MNFFFFAAVPVLTVPSPASANPPLQRACLPVQQVYIYTHTSYIYYIPYARTRARTQKHTQTSRTPSPSNI